MRLTYESQTMNGFRWYRCTVETYEAGTRRRGVSQWHPTKGLAKADALSSLEAVLA